VEKEVIKKVEVEEKNYHNAQFAGIGYSGNEPNQNNKSFTSFVPSTEPSNQNIIYINQQNKKKQPNVEEYDPMKGSSSSDPPQHNNNTYDPLTGSTSQPIRTSRGEVYKEAMMKSWKSSFTKGQDSLEASKDKKNSNSGKSRWGDKL